MGWPSDYQKKVSEVESSVESKVSDSNVRNLEAMLDDVLPFAFLLLGLALLFSFVIPVSQRFDTLVNWATYAVVSYFSLRLLVQYRLSSSRRAFVRDHWLDIAILLPAFSLFKEIKVLRFLESSRAGAYPAEVAAGTLNLQNTAVAARLTKIIRMIKRSLSF